MYQSKRKIRFVVGAMQIRLMMMACLDLLLKSSICLTYSIHYFEIQSMLCKDI